MSIGVSLCTVEYNQCCVYSKINTYETLTHHKGSSGVCSKNNWNTECILNMCHTPIFRIIVWFINLNYLLNGESIIMGQNKNFQFLHTAIIIVTLITAIFGWVFYCWKPRKKLVNFIFWYTQKLWYLLKKTLKPCSLKTDGSYFG